jgi:hypothetical protein
MHQDGTFHIKGPILVQDSQYIVRLTIVAKDSLMLSKAITDTFVLSPQSGISTSR